MKILIIGATGGTGKELVKQALGKNYAVTALVRNPKNLNIKDNNLNILKGDILDPAIVNKAVNDQDCVISALGHKKWFRPTNILSEGTKNIITSMNKYNVSRFICETSLSVSSSFGKMGLYYTFFTIPIILQFYFWDKYRQEKIIKESSVDWTIVQPGALNNRKPKGKWKEGDKVGNYLWTVGISRADVADFMLSQIDDKRYIRETVGISW
ncbi:MAG: SDR family oxidoreductase [Ignavibacteriaceae bacterium]